MKAPSDPVLAQTVMDLLPICDRREPVRVLVASLALGGAERIVLEWLGAEAARQRTIELAVLHPRRIAWTPPAGIAATRRNRSARAQPADTDRISGGTGRALADGSYTGIGTPGQ